MAQKAIGLVINETKEQIAKIINSSGLPASVTTMILQGFLSQASIAEQNELQFDQQKYKEQLEEEKSQEFKNKFAENEIEDDDNDGSNS